MSQLADRLASFSRAQALAADCVAGGPPGARRYHDGAAMAYAEAERLVRVLTGTANG